MAECNYDIHKKTMIDVGPLTEDKLAYALSIIGLLALVLLIYFELFIRGKK